MNQAICENVLFEACVDSVESAMAAEAGGAARVELCAALIEGGLTPSAGAIELARRSINIPLHVIIRPRGGDFLYTAIEFEAMRRDVVAAKQLGANGAVIGLLKVDGSVDVERTQELIELARPMSVTFHRAFDMTADPFKALADLIALGVDRILTSGQEDSALEGLDLITELIKAAGDRLIIMPGGGITSRNAKKIAAGCGAKEIHAYTAVSEGSQMQFRNPRTYMGGALRPPEYARAVTQSNGVAEILKALKG